MSCPTLMRGQDSLDESWQGSGVFLKARPVEWHKEARPDDRYSDTDYVCITRAELRELRRKAGQSPLRRKKATS